jgi:hypothetical protein
MAADTGTRAHKGSMELGSIEQSERLLVISALCSTREKSRMSNPNQNQNNQGQQNQTPGQKPGQQQGGGQKPGQQTQDPNRQGQTPNPGKDR